MRRPAARLCLLAALAWVDARAESARVAVAANFADAAAEIARLFEARTEHRIVLVPGSTGKLHAQIDLGAPFDALLAADAASPERLVSDGRAVEGSRFTYAVGRLVLWSTRAGFVDQEGAVLAQDDWKHLAIANPETAPYGKAALQVLERLGLTEKASARLVRGESVAQAFHFVATGSAELGFVALSQLRATDREPGGSMWIVPERLHDPIAQQAVLLTRAKDNRAAVEYLAFLRGAEARAVIERLGYR